jgi:hypothetical protein
MLAGGPQQFAYSSIIVLSAPLGDCDVQQERHESVPLWFSEPRQLGLPVTLIGVEILQQTVEKGSLNFRSGNPGGWRSAWAERSRAEQTHNQGRVVRRSQRVFRSFFAFQLVEAISLGGPGRKDAHLILNAGEDAEAKGSRSAPTRPAQWPCQKYFSGKIVVLVVETFGE